MPHTKPHLDPMNKVVPYEMLKAAHWLISQGQNEKYWASVPVPVRPIGKLRFEASLQLMVFAFPILGLAWLSSLGGLKGLLVGLPAAWLVGFLFHQCLDSVIDAKARREREIDVGRYLAVKWLSEQMGMRREEVTLDVIRKMDKDFAIVQRIIDERTAEIAANKRAAATANQNRHRSRGGYVATGSSAQAAAVVHGAEYAAAADVAYNDVQAHYAPATEFYAPNTELGFNPVSGLPMVEGTCMDVHGNMLGMNDQF